MKKKTAATLTLGTSSFKTAKEARAWAKAAGSKVKLAVAQWSDDKLVYSCQRLVYAAVAVLRGLEDGEGVPFAELAGQAVVCATVCASHFNCSDEATLAERIGACNELAACCEQLAEALDGHDFDGSKWLETAARECLAQCQETAGTEEEEADGPAHSEEAAAAPVVSKASVKPVAKKGRPGWLTVMAQADGSHRININGLIGASVVDKSGICAAEFNEALDAIPDSDHIHMHIDSDGGSLPDGISIYNAVKARRPNVTSHVSSALSCASLVALAAEEVVSPVTSMWMLHNARVDPGMCDAAQLKECVDMVEAYSDMMADLYAEETGQDKKEVIKVMNKQTWFTGEQAVAWGLADTTDESEEDTALHDTEVPRTEAVARARLIMAMYQPPEEFWQLISARASASGTAGKPPVNQPQNSMSEKAATLAAPATATNTLEARFNRERNARVTGEVTRRAQGKLKNDQLPWWIKQAVDAETDEAETAVYAQLEGLPQAAAPGGAPLAGDAAPADASGVVTEMANRVYAMNRPVAARDLRWGDDPPRLRTAFQENVRRLPHAERVKVHRREWGQHFLYCNEKDLAAYKAKNMPVPQAADTNTYSTTLITDFLVDVAVTILQNRWAPLEAVTRDFSTDRYKPLATGQIKLVGAGSTTLVGTKGSPITSFETGSSNTTNVSIAVNHYSQPFAVAQDELMNGLRLENLVSINLAVLSNTILTNVLSNLVTGGLAWSGSTWSTAAFSAGTCNALPGTFTWNSNPGMPKLWGYLRKSPIKNAILDPVFMANLINQPGYYQPSFTGERAGDRAMSFGWDVIAANTLWPSLNWGGTNALAGIALNPQGLGALSGLPMNPPNIPGATLQESVITIPGPDISISSYLWFSLNTRSLWNSFDIMFGSAGMDSTAIALLFNGAGAVS